MTEAAVGLLTWVQEQRHLTDVRQDPRDHAGQRLGKPITFNRDIDVHPISIPVRQRLGGKAGTKAVLGGHGADNCVEGDSVVSSHKGV